MAGGQGVEKVARSVKEPGLRQHRVELLLPPRAHRVAVMLLDLLAGHGGDKAVAAHAHVSVDPPQRHVVADLGEAARPGERVVVVGIEQGAVDVDEGDAQGSGHGAQVPGRMDLVASGVHRYSSALEPKTAGLLLREHEGPPKADGLRRSHRS